MNRSLNVVSLSACLCWICLTSIFSVRLSTGLSHRCIVTIVTPNGCSGSAAVQGIWHRDFSNTHDPLLTWKKFNYTQAHRIGFQLVCEQSSKLSFSCMCVCDSGLFTEITGFRNPPVVIWVTTLGKRRHTNTHTSLIAPCQSHPRTFIRANVRRYGMNHTLL